MLLNMKRKLIYFLLLETISNIFSLKNSFATCTIVQERSTQTDDTGQQSQSSDPPTDQDHLKNAEVSAKDSEGVQARQPSSAEAPVQAETSPNAASTGNSEAEATSIDSGVVADKEKSI